MRLVIAEKHSVAQAIGQALGDSESHDGYITAGGVLISWAQGHLVGLAMPDAYQGEAWADPHWSMESLPIAPAAWKWAVSHEKGADKRYRELVALASRDDVDELVNACDPDREGEAIFRRVMEHAGIDKPSLRLWVASLDEHAIRDAWRSMRPESDYRGLGDSADARAKADWLVGMNASRAHTVAYRRRLSVGRVQTPTLAMVVDRDAQIAGHVAKPFWRVEAPMGGWKLAGERLDKREDAETLLRIVNSDDFAFSIFKAERKQQHDAPPRLYDLTGLQKDMSRLHGLTAARTLAALQSLYEKKLATYPRTDSQYITHDDLDTLRGLTEGDRLVNGFIEPAAKPERPRLELTVNDAKVAGHTAILPTMQADKAALDELGDDERLVLVRVARRMWEAVGDDYVHDVTNVVANIDPHWCEKHPDEGRLLSEGECRFTSRSDQPVSLGWHAIEHDGPQEDQDDNDEAAGNIIPANLVTGVSIAPVPQCGATLSEGQTKPPKPFTEATLLAAMEHASRWVEDKDLKAALDDDESHSGGIGTPATRANIIEQLVHAGYMERKGKQLRSTPEGRLLVKVVTPELKDVKLTAQWESMLSDIEHGQGDEDAFLRQIGRMCAGLPARVRAMAESAEGAKAVKAARAQNSYGPCPRCGKPVVKTGSIWQCSSNKSVKDGSGKWTLSEGCGYKIFAEKFGRKLTDSMVRRTLEGKRPKVSGLKSKAGKTFDARLVPDRQYGIGLSFDGPDGKRK